MIPFDFTYHKPTNPIEAYELYLSLLNSGKRPMYYAGGTEIITLGRLNHIYTDAVIDIKSIPECQIYEIEGDFLYLGAARTLNEIQGMREFPLLSMNVGEIADHTAREKITLGGNICGNIYYREAVLPFLLTDSYLVICGPDGMSVRSIHEVFDKEVKFNEGEFLVQTITERSLANLPHVNIKRRKQWDTGYPVITASALIYNNSLRVAISGLCPFPFRSYVIESFLNEKSLSHFQRVDNIIEHLPKPILNDSEASSAYRIFVLKNILLEILEAFERGR